MLSTVLILLFIFFHRALNKDVFIFNEVIDPGDEAVKATDYIEYTLDGKKKDLGIITEFKYSTEIGRLFRKHKYVMYAINIVCFPDTLSRQIN